MVGSVNDHFCKCSVLYLRWHSRWLGQKLPKIRWRIIWMVPKGIHRGVKALSDGPSRLALGIPWKQFNYSCYTQNLPWKLRQQRVICWNSLAYLETTRMNYVFLEIKRFSASVKRTLWKLIKFQLIQHIQTIFILFFLSVVWLSRSFVMF